MAFIELFMNCAHLELQGHTLPVCLSSGSSSSACAHSPPPLPPPLRCTTFSPPKWPQGAAFLRATVSWAGPETRRILRNPNSHCSTNMNSTLLRTDSAHAIPAYFCITHFNIILTSTPTSSKWSLSFRFSYQTLHAFLFFPHVPHFTLLYLIIRILFG